jgi:hypothetical protein
MDLKQQLNIDPGQYIVANCGKMPSENNCKLVIMAPSDQREDLLDAALDHAIKKHGHQNSPELRDSVDKMLETVEIQ